MGGFFLDAQSHIAHIFLSLLSCSLQDLGKQLAKYELRVRELTRLAGLKNPEQASSENSNNNDGDDNNDARTTSEPSLVPVRQQQQQQQRK